MRRLLVAAVVGALAFGAACTAQPVVSRPPHTPVPSAAPRAVTKVLVVIEENHSLDQMREGMPYAYQLAERFGYATNYYAVSHPSLPNYLAITGGQTYGITDDAPPSAHPLRGPSVFGQAIALGRTARVYADGMPGNCATDTAGSYAVKHNPWAYFVSERASCQAYDLPLEALGTDIERGRLPNVGMVVPDTCHDAHNCDLAVADAWFQRLMNQVFAGPDWASGHLAVVLTADEDDHNQDNLVLTVVIHPSQRQNVVTQRLDHYSLARLYEDVVGAPHLANAATAPSLSAAFGLPLR